MTTNSGHCVIFRAYADGPWSYRGHHPSKGTITAGGFPTQLHAITHAVGFHRFDTWETLS
jgi:hypothetical protein